MAGNPEKADDMGDSVILTAKEYVCLTRSITLREGGRNRGKNTNIFQAVNARSFAAQVVEFGAMRESTSVVLMPETPEFGTKEKWLHGIEKALEVLPEDDVS